MKRRAAIVVRSGQLEKSICTAGTEEARKGMEGTGMEVEVIQRLLGIATHEHNST
jgi:hypothetical protein